MKPELHTDPDLISELSELKHLKPHIYAANGGLPRTHFRAC